ncbi:MAG: hypothetical protein KAV87_04430 [Desulfobacteraceae bacterium]|nr:hypothetical protein [Desulfobacteraceae bacterium]
MSKFRKALIYTAIPIVVLHLISISLWLAEYDHLAEQIGWGASGLLVIAIVAAIVCSIRGVKQTAKGIWLGCGIGLVAFIVMWIVSY